MMGLRRRGSSIARFAVAAPLALLVLAPSRPAADSDASVRPSILLVTLDTTRADHLGCYGARGVETPNLDALARSGARFDAALSPVPLTLPSHASILTGRVPRRHGVRDNALFRLPGDVPVLTSFLRDRGYSTAAFVSSVVLDGSLGLARGFELYDDHVEVGEREAFNYEERAASQTNDAVLERLPAIQAPFFLWVHYFDPHFTYVPPEPYRTRFKDRPYDGEIAFVDREFGRLLRAVRAKGAPLVVVVAGDHGESLGDHGEPTHGALLYQATQRVPLLLAGPGIPEGKTIGRNVGLIDVAPTILDLAGTQPIGGADGRSLLPLLRGAAPVAPDYEMETFFPRFAYGWSPLRAVQRGRLKYVEAPRPELYDVEADPAESRNVLSVRARDARGLSAALGRLTAGDAPRPFPADPELAEQRRRLEALGYVSGAAAAVPEAPIDPKDGIVWLADLDAARRDLQLGDPKDGIPRLERLLARNPQNVNATLTLIQCHLAAGNLDAAVALGRRAVEMSPENDMARLNLANALAAKGRTDAVVRSEARSEYERALALDPRQAEVYLAYAAFLAPHATPDEVVRLFERARAAGVRHPDIELELGLIHLALRRPGPAREALERAVSWSPRFAPALEGLGKIAYDGGEPALAAGYYARALEARPTSELARTLGAIRLFQLGDREGARRAFERALELARPDDPAVPDLRDLLRDLAPRPTEP